MRYEEKDIKKLEVGYYAVECQEVDKYIIEVKTKGISYPISFICLIGGDQRFSTTGGFESSSDAFSFRPATEEEAHWIKSCVEANIFIHKDKLIPLLESYEIY